MPDKSFVKKLGLEEVALKTDISKRTKDEIKALELQNEAAKKKDKAQVLLDKNQYGVI